MSNNCPRARRRVEVTSKHGRRFGSVCSGPFVLAAAGLLDGRLATTHWDHAATLGQMYPEGAGLWRAHPHPRWLHLDERRSFGGRRPCSRNRAGKERPEFTSAAALTHVLRVNVACTLTRQEDDVDLALMLSG